MERISKVLEHSLPNTHQHLTTGQTHSVQDTRKYKPDDNCPQCHGCGFLHPLGIDGEPVYSQVVSCECYVKARMAYLNGAQYHAEQGARPAHQTFDNFLLMPGSRDAFNAAKAWVDPKAKFLWLLIYGGVGNGKSHLCNAALDVLLRRGVKAKLVTASQLLAQLRTAMSDHTTDAVMAEYQTILDLIVDDLGAGMKHPGEPASEWEWARVEELLVARYERMLPTMVVTNLDWSQLPERLASRFDDREMARRIENTAPDYRSQK